MSNHRLQSLGGPLASSWEFPSLLLGIKHNPCFEHWDQDAHNREIHEMLKTHFRFHEELFIYANLHLARFFINFHLRSPVLVNANVIVSAGGRPLLSEWSTCSLRMNCCQLEMTFEKVWLTMRPLHRIYIWKGVTKTALLVTFRWIPTTKILTPPLLITASASRVFRFLSNLLSHFLLRSVTSIYSHITH